MVRLKHLLDAAVEPLDHAVGLGVLRWGKAVFDAKVATEQVERVLATGRALAQAEQAVCELFAIHESTLGSLHGRRDARGTPQ